MTKVKICGITNLEDAIAAVDAGADALGFVFYAQSPRNISVNDAAAIVRELPPFVASVGVFVDASKEDIYSAIHTAGLTAVQMHGLETPDLCRSFGAISVIKAFRIRELGDLSSIADYTGLSAYLLDAYSASSMGGTGMVFNWDIAIEARRYGRIILAGGLTPDNVAEAVRRVRPYAVDVSSGVELHKGKKDHTKLREFIKRAKEA